jgi:UDP-2,3-diacylglucosamine pyrophosphatase LpxH
MLEMLVIISDLHLTDGTSGTTVDPGAFDMFADRLRDMAARASWRADGHYRPIERIDLVLLGDVLDLVRSQQWLAGDVRPWSDTTSPQVIESVNTITDEILAKNAHSLATLRSLAAESAVCVAPSDHSGNPVYNGEGQPVPVRTHYMVGNHDWFLHLRGPSYDLLRQKISHHMGLANSHNEPFPHDPVESEELLDALRRHRVFARHGDIFDPINFTEDRDTSSLGDAIVVELLSRFVVEVQNQLGEDLPAGVINALREIDNIRPVLLVPVWIEGMLERLCPSPAIRKSVKRIWDGLADEFLNLPMVRDHNTWSPFDLVDGLERALKFSKRLSIGWSSQIGNWMNGLRGATSDSYVEHALAEQDFRNRRARHIVYGHTHGAESMPLDASYADGFVLNQMYFNAGTWRRVYKQTQWAPGEREFIAADNLSVLGFYQGDERSGRSFETWNGTLGASAAEFSVHRVDAGQNASPQSVSTPNVPVNSPHFAAAGATRVGPVRRI